MEVSVTGRIMEDVQKLVEVGAKCLHVRALTQPQLMVEKPVLVHFRKADHVIQIHVQVFACSLVWKTDGFIYFILLILYLQKQKMLTIYWQTSKI